MWTNGLWTPSQTNLFKKNIALNMSRETIYIKIQLSKYFIMLCTSLMHKITGLVITIIPSSDELTNWRYLKQW